MICPRRVPVAGARTRCEHATTTAVAQTKAARRGRPRLRALPRRHDYPGRGAGVGCRHAHGLDIVWSARHGVTTPLGEKSTAPEAQVDVNAERAAATDQQFRDIVDQGIVAARAAAHASVSNGATKPGRRRREKMPATRGPATALALLCTVLAVGGLMLVGSVLGLAYLAGLNLGAVALGLAVTVVGVAFWFRIFRSPVRRALAGALEGAPGLCSARCSRSRLASLDA